MTPDHQVPLACSLLLLLTMALAGCAQQPTTGPDQGVIEAAPVEPLSAEHQAQLSAALAASADGEWLRAHATLAGLIAARPDLADLRARLGWVRQQQGDQEAARTLYREALAVDPDHVMARNNLALLLQDAGEFEAAAALLKEGIERGLTAPQLHFNLAVLSELYLLDLETALAHYQAYQHSTGEADGQVKGWIADLERRLR